MTSQDVANCTPVVDHITLSCLGDLLNCVHVAESSRVFNSMIWAGGREGEGVFVRSMFYNGDCD